MCSWTVVSLSVCSSVLLPTRAAYKSVFFFFLRWGGLVHGLLLSHAHTYGLEAEANVDHFFSPAPISSFPFSVFRRECNCIVLARKHVSLFKKKYKVPFHVFQKGVKMPLKIKKKLRDAIVWNE